MSTVVEDRLWADYDGMTRFRSDVVSWEAFDLDPERLRPPVYYRVHYKLKSIVDWKGDEPVYHTGYEVNLDLNPPYPTWKASAWFVGPIPWHPNINPKPESGHICYEDRWIKGIGIELHKIVELIGMIIAFQLYTDIDRPDDLPPIRRDEGFWERFRKSRHLFPTDTNPIRLSGGGKRSAVFGAATSP